MLKNSFLFVVMVFLLAGCAINPYKQYYFDQTGGQDVLKSPYIVSPPEVPKVFRGDKPDKDGQKMLEEGYVMIGHSLFNAGEVSDSAAVGFGKQIHASVVLVYSQYTNTTSGTIPITYPETTTIKNNKSGMGLFSGSGYGSGNIYGPGGSAHYSDTSSVSGTAMLSGSSTTTITQPKTTYVPYSVNRYDYLATYWIQSKPPVLGIQPKDLSSEERKQIGTNKGIAVLAVIKGTPAFLADVFKDDIITKFDGRGVIDSADFLQSVQKSQGKKVVLTVLRDGKTINKEVQLRTREQ